MTLEAVFLGKNKAGEQIYSWLNRREDVEVKAILTEKEQLDLVERLRPDIVISAGFEHKVPKEIIEVPPKGIVNLHPSYLPYNRGAHPHIWSIREGTPAGVTAHYMTEEIDEGPVIDRREVRVLPEDTARTLYDRLIREQVEQFKDIWSRVKQGAEAEPQDLDEGTHHYGKELDELCELDMDEKVRVGEFIDRLRALTFPPYDTAYFERYGEKYFIEISITPESEKES